MEDRAMRSPTRGRRPGRSIAAVFTLTFAGALAACSGASAPAAAPAGGPAALPAASSATSAGEAPGGNGNNSGVDTSSGGGQPGTGGGQVALVDDAKIVRTGTLQLTVADTTKALAAGRDLIRNLGGYIGGSQQERNGDEIVASVTYRIPVASWEDALNGLRGLGTEVGEKTDAVEVTGQLVDLDARIRNLKASETALVGYAQNAPKVSDLLEIEARLTDTRGQIERLTAQQAQLSDQAAYATLTVTFGTDVVAVIQTSERWDPAAEVDRATATLIGMGQAVVSFLIVFAIVWVPLILVISIIGLMALLVARRLGWRRSGPYPLAPPPPPSSVEA
jgi:uncharacterized protein DUF4349